MRSGTVYKCANCPRYEMAEFGEGGGVRMASSMAATSQKKNHNNERYGKRKVDPVLN
jgi:hypothetical protein